MLKGRDFGKIKTEGWAGKGTQAGRARIFLFGGCLIAMVGFTALFTWQEKKTNKLKTRLENWDNMMASRRTQLTQEERQHALEKIDPEYKLNKAKLRNSKEL